MDTNRTRYMDVAQIIDAYELSDFQYLNIQRDNEKKELFSSSSLINSIFNEEVPKNKQVVGMSGKAAGRVEKEQQV
ncbi:hypothetical protein [Vibrio sp. 99-70-13A1]|uniref:hypothetical protein n=1 Tax=Vibrio sp. 99-70-13A1 TaxID=2607601 RepID=UPI0014935417|nr:hypothetical protein [Vibrio sp. 99-70-13A1]NOH98107.1 hypothetical protein [Vibrio sp. 99-70-13A1]